MDTARWKDLWTPLGRMICEHS